MTHFSQFAFYWLSVYIFIPQKTGNGKAPSSSGKRELAKKLPEAIEMQILASLKLQPTVFKRPRRPRSEPRRRRMCQTRIFCSSENWKMRAFPGFSLLLNKLQLGLAKIAQTGKWKRKISRKIGKRWHASNSRINGNFQGSRSSS